MKHSHCSITVSLNEVFSCWIWGEPKFERENLPIRLWGVFAVRYGFGPFLTPHFAVRFSQNHNCTVPHFCFHMCDAMWCSAVLSLTKIITASHLIFAATCAVRYLRCSLNNLKLVYFLNFEFFMSSPKLFFPLFCAKF